MERTSLFKKTRTYYSFWIALGMGILYFLFPTANSGLDAYAYAADVQTHTHLFRSHHLLYGVLGYLWSMPVQKMDILPVLCCMNACFAFLSLLVIRKILLLQYKENETAVWVLLSGSMYGFMRFATENETYIIPIFFSLLGTFFLLKKKTNTSLFLSGLFAAIACLFHQIHFFWWLILGIYSVTEAEKKGRALVSYTVPALLVPLVYGLVYRYTEHSAASFFQYIFYDYYTPYASTSFQPLSFLLTPISLIRNFVQVHGYLIPFCKQYPLAVVPFLIIVSMGIKALFILFKTTFQPRQPGRKKAFLFLLIGLVQLSFAFFSAGNAEFMVMIPLLTVLWLAFRFERIPTKAVLFLGCSMGMWNLFFGLIPSHFLQLNANKVLTAEILKHPETVYVLKDKPEIESRIVYEVNCLPKESKLHKQAFLLLDIRKQQTLPFQELLKDKGFFVTDIHHKQAFNRAALLQHTASGFPEAYRLISTKELEYDLGVLRLETYRLTH